MAKRASWSEKINWPKGIEIAAGAVLGHQLAKWGIRRAVKRTSNQMVGTIMTDPYGENLWEFISAATRVGPQVIVETNLRAQEGEVIQRPLGPPKKFPTLEDLMFSIGQFHVMPTPLETPVDTRVTFGKNRPRPVTVDTPIMVSGMAYGVGLSKEAKIALAKGASMAGAAHCSGEGPYLPEEHQAAGKCYIYQYHRGDWNKTDAILSSADMIEIQFGQGAIGGVGHVFQAQKIDSELREGAPIGAKMGAGKYLEADLEWLADAEIDYIALEGGEAATKGSAPSFRMTLGFPQFLPSTGQLHGCGTIR